MSRAAEFCGANREPIEALETKILRKPYLSILPPIDLDRQMEIDQSCLKERQREHVARMHMERIIELIAAALPELETRTVASPTEVWAKVNPFEQAIRLRRGAR